MNTQTGITLLSEHFLWLCHKMWQYCMHAHQLIPINFQRGGGRQSVNCPSRDKSREDVPQLIFWQAWGYVAGWKPRMHGVSHFLTIILKFSSQMGDKQTMKMRPRSLCSCDLRLPTQWHACIAELGFRFGGVGWSCAPWRWSGYWHE
jgi:hypothetical protein